MTKIQEQVLGFIRQHISRDNMPPTYDEIAGHFGYKSKNSVETHLRALARKGLIRRAPGKSRGIILIKSAQQSDKNGLIPLLGTIAAGQPIEAQQNIEDYLDLNRMFGSSPVVFALRVKGESMVNAGIFDGDIIVVRRQDQVEDGEIGAVLVNDEATVKRVFVKKGRLVLKPENDSMKEMVFEQGKDNCMVLGKMVGLIRRNR
jgi:repressor LexA